MASSQSTSDEIEVLHDPGEHQEREPSLLRPPLRSHLSRKRKIEKPVTTNKNKAGPHTLAVRSGKIFCTACHEELAPRRALSRTI